MFLLPIARREARETSRRPRVYHARWIIAGLALGAMLLGIWMAPSGAEQGHFVFNALATLAQLYALFAGVIVASDAIAFERREGTLGLLFLTDLRPVDVLLGKLISTSATAAFGLLAFMPTLAIPMLLGGVSLDRFLLLAIELANTLFVSIACGFVVSTLFRQSWSALAASLSAIIAIGIIAPFLTFSFDWLEPLSFLTPTTAYVGLLAPTGASYVDLSEFLESIAFTNVCGFAAMALVCVRLAYLWRDRPPAPRAQRISEWLQRLRFGSRKSRAHLREKLLDQSPLAWLGNRERVSSWGVLTFCFIVFAGVLALSMTTGEFFDTSLGICGLALAHLALFFRICVAASHQIAEDRRSGALELLLSTPLRPREVVRGRWLALGRQFFGPAIVVMLMHLVTLAFVVFRRSTESWHLNLFQAALVNELSEDHLPSIVLIASLFIMPANWIAAGWLGMWLGLRSRSSGVAIWKTFTFVAITPWLLLAAGTLAWVLLGLHQLFWSRAFVFGTVLAFCIGLANPGVQMHLARRRLLRHFRVAAVDPLAFSRVRFPWIKVFKWTTGAALFCALVLCSIWLWRNRLNDRAKQKWEAALAAHPQFLLQTSSTPDQKIPDEQNLAHAPLLEPLNGSVNSRQRRQPGAAYAIARRTITRERVYNFRSPFSMAFPAPRPGTLLVQPHLWRDGQMINVKEYEDYALRRGIITNKFGSPSRSILATFKSIDPFIVEIKAEAGKRPFTHFEQQNYILTEISSALAIHAIARLRLGEAPVDDVALILRLGEGTLHIHTQQPLAEHAFQPIYEGLMQRRWSDENLILFERELAKFDQWASEVADIKENTRVHLVGLDDQHESAISEGPAVVRLWQKFWPVAKLFETKTLLIGISLDEVLPAIDLQSKCFRPGALAALEARGQMLLQGEVHQTFAALMLNDLEQFACFQTSIDEVRVACALERYRLAKNRYPDRLEELASGFIDAIPNDLFTCKPLFYRPAEDRQDFMLYSVGWDCRDSGGRSPPNTYWNADRGVDWVWNPRHEPE